MPHYANQSELFFENVVSRKTNQTRPRSSLYDCDMRDAAINQAAKMRDGWHSPAQMGHGHCCVVGLKHDRGSIAVWSATFLSHQERLPWLPCRSVVTIGGPGSPIAKCENCLPFTVISLVLQVGDTHRLSKPLKKKHLPAGAHPGRRTHGLCIRLWRNLELARLARLFGSDWMV